MGREGIKALLAHWMFSDQRLWRRHKKIHLWILNQRLIKGKSYIELEKAHNIDSDRFKRLLDDAIKKVEKTHGKDLASFLREIDRELDGVRQVMLN